MKKATNERTNEQADERTNKRTNERTNKRTTERTKKRISFTKANASCIITLVDKDTRASHLRKLSLKQTSIGKKEHDS